MLLLIDNYDSFTYNLAQYLGELGEEVRVVRNDAISLDEIGRLAPARIVISPGPCTPNEAGISLDLIRAFAGKIPILGVCLGHQAIGQAFGGKIVGARTIMHGKLSKVFHDEHGVYVGLPNPFVATRYHSLVIEPHTLPDSLEVTAKTWDDEIMGVRHKRFAGGPAPIEGVQFHPESIMTSEGKRLLGNFLALDQGPLMLLPEGLAKLLRREHLTSDEMAALIGTIMDGNATPAQIGGLLVALRMKGETADELAGAARAMRARATPIRCPDPHLAVDTCGTGGDNSSSVNVSTIAAIVAAAAGVRVAKHGNRAQSSRSGSADVLVALGVRIDAPVAVTERCLAEVGIGFLFAPQFHAATRHAAGPRKELGTRTLFNLLGPLTNPAGVGRQVVGVFDPGWVVPMAEALGSLGAERVFVVHGEGGIDECAVAGRTIVAEHVRGATRTFHVTPAEFGLAEADPAGLRGGDAEENAAITRALLGGAPGAVRTAVIMEAALALVAADAAADLTAAAQMAAQAIDSGKGAEKLARWAETSHTAP